MQYYQRNEESVRREKEGVDFFYNLKAGRTVLRVLPPYSKEGLWFKKIKEYPVQLGDLWNFLIAPPGNSPDPIAEYAAELYEEGDVDSIEKAKNFRPTTRYLINAILLSDPKGNSIKNGVQVVKIPTKVKTILVDLDMDAESGYGDISNPENGFNIIIEKSGKGLNTEYTVKAHRERSNIIEFARQQGENPDKWELANLDERAKPASIAELKQALDALKGLTGRSSEPVEVQETPVEETEVTIDAKAPVPTEAEDPGPPPAV